MARTLTLHGDVYRKLAQGAAERGMTIEGLLAAVSDLLVLRERATAQDCERSARIDRLLELYRAGRLSPEDSAELDQLIGADYEAANSRADRLISAKGRRPRSARANGKHRET